MLSLKRFFRLSPTDYVGLHRRYAAILGEMPQQASLAFDAGEIGRKLKDLFSGMMRALFLQEGASFKVEIVADPAVQEFVGAHASVLDSSFEKVEMSEAMRRRLSRSNYIFSGMKAFHELHEAFPSLLDENGDKKPFERFLNDVLSIDRTYNVNYLRAEYNFVSASAEMAARWERFMADGDRYNLQYRTQKDGKVRPEHAALHGVTLPPSDPFWEEFYPPNGWNCFVAGTPVLTDRGWMPIEQITSGMTVVGGSGQYRTVIGTHAKPVNQKLVRVITERSRAVCTQNHRFLTHRGWVTAGCLNPGDILVQVGEVSFKNIFVNAIHNTAVMIKYCLVSLKGKREAVAPLTVDDYPQFGYEKIHNVYAAKVSNLDMKLHCKEVLEQQRLRFAQAGSQCAHPFGMDATGGQTVTDGLSHRLFPEKRGCSLQLFRNAAQKVAVGFRLALANVKSLLGKLVIYGGEVHSGGSSSCRVVNPLRGYRIAPVTDINAVFPEYTPHRPLVYTPVGGKPSEAAFLQKIPLFRGLACIHSFNGFDSVFDFLRRTFLHTRYNIVEAKVTLNKSVSKVYNLSVDVDESYVIPLGIVHNCRCTVIQVRKSKYPVTPHDEAMRLGDEALQRDKKGIFRFNAGKEGKSVPDYNPYTIRRCSTCPIAKGDNGGQLSQFVPDNEVCQACVRIHQCEDARHYSNHPDFGKRLRISDIADKSELSENIRAACALLKSFPKMEMELRPHIIAENVKNPEYIIDGLVADRKGIMAEQGITAGFKKALKQGCEAVVIDLDMNMGQKPLLTRKLAQFIDGRKRDFEDGRIKACYVIYQGKAIKITSWQSRQELTAQIEKLRP